LTMPGSGKRPRLSGQGPGAAVAPAAAAFQKFACTGQGLPSSVGLTSPVGTAAAAVAGGSGLGVVGSEPRSGQLVAKDAASGGTGNNAGRLCTLPANSSQLAGSAGYGGGGGATWMGGQGVPNTARAQQQQQQQWPIGEQQTGTGQPQYQQPMTKRLSSIPFSSPMQHQQQQFTGQQQPLPKSGEQVQLQQLAAAQGEDEPRFVKFGPRG
jgi:hypothetical protein